LEILGEYIHTLARDGISAGMSGIPAAHNQLSLFSFPVCNFNIYSFAGLPFDFGLFSFRWIVAESKKERELLMQLHVQLADSEHRQ
jgi:hypothetical protein